MYMDICTYIHVRNLIDRDDYRGISVRGMSGDNIGIVGIT